MKTLIPKISTISFIASLSVAATDTSAYKDSSTEDIAKAIIDKITVKARSFDAKLDEFNRNVYVIDKSLIESKGFKTTQEIFDYVPFVTKNDLGLGTLGLGASIDLRGQGANANTNVQVLLNGTLLNMTDTSHGSAIIDTISPSDIERIEILPGGGAVMYGSGTKGGVINIITKKRYESFSPSVGISYTGLPGYASSPGYSGDFKIYGSDVNVDARFGGKITDNLYYTISGRYLYKYGYNIGDQKNIGTASGNLTWDINDKNTLALDMSYFTGVIDSSMGLNTATKPSINQRYDEGSYPWRIKQNRADVVLTWDNTISDNSTFQAKAFYHYFMSYFFGDYIADDNILSSSYFQDQKSGLNFKYDYKTKRNTFLLGYDFTWNNAGRLYDVGGSGNGFLATNNMAHTKLLANQIKNALYVIDKYNLTNRFSLTGGIRYEYAHSFNLRTHKTEPNIRSFGDQNNVALEITPRLDLSDSSNIYAKYERGYRSLGPDIISSMALKNYTLHPEYYNTFELGYKTTSSKYFTTSATLFYTLTENEIYNYEGHGISSAISTAPYSQYDLTQRYGIEIFLEEYFYNKRLRFTESFTWIDATILDEQSYSRRIPYISNYKATFGANYDISRNFSIWTQNSFVGDQRDAQNKEIDGYILTDLGLDSRFGDFSLTTGVRNLFDSLYFVYFNSGSRYGKYIYGPGRSFFADLRYAF